MRKWHGSEEVKKSGSLQNYTQENNLITITWNCLETDKSESAKILRDRSGASDKRAMGKKVPTRDYSLIWGHLLLPEKGVNSAYSSAVNCCEYLVFHSFFLFEIFISFSIPAPLLSIERDVAW